MYVINFVINIIKVYERRVLYYFPKYFTFIIFFYFNFLLFLKHSNTMNLIISCIGIDVRIITKDNVVTNVPIYWVVSRKQFLWRVGLRNKRSARSFKFSWNEGKGVDIFFLYSKNMTIFTSSFSLQCHLQKLFSQKVVVTSLLTTNVILFNILRRRPLQFKNILAITFVIH